MKSQLQIFDEWTHLCLQSDQGFPLRFDPIPVEIAQPFNEQRETFQRQLATLEKMFLPGKKIEIYMDYLDDGFCDAVAGLHDGIALVGIYRGTIMLPLDAFNRMLAHPLIFQGLGESQRERRSIFHDDGLPENYDALISKRQNRKAKYIAPLDPTRRGVAALCMYLVYGFLSVHELVHIVHGHVEYLYRVYGGVMSYPFRAVGSPSTALPPQSVLDYQTIELCADGKAIAVTLGGLLNGSVGLMADRWFPTPEGKIFVWSFAIYTLFRIWDFRIDPDNMQDRHPPTAMRLDMAIGAASLEIEKRFPNFDMEAFCKAVNDGIQEAEKAIGFIGERPLQREKLEHMRHPKADAHLDHLADHYNRVLLPMLLQYSHVKLDDITPVNTPTP